MKRFVSFVLPALLVVLPLLVYLKTLPPSLLWVDSGTMVAAAYTLGIPNPPGFPLYMLVGHAFTLLPFGSVLFRMQLLSVVFATGTVFFIYQSIRVILGNLGNKGDLGYWGKEIGAFLGTIALAFSYQFWSQSHNTDAFMFTDFFIALLLFLVLKIHLPGAPQAQHHLEGERKTWRKWILLAIIYGLAGGANPTVVQLMPSVLLVYYYNRHFLSRRQILGLLGVFGLLGILVYLYLPIRAAASPFVNWGNPRTLPSFLHHVLGGNLNVYAPEASIVNGFTGSPEVFIQSLLHFVWLSFLQFTPVLFPLIFLGGYTIWKQSRKLFWILIAPVVFTALYSSLYFSGNQESWYIGPFMMFAIFIGVGYWVLFQTVILSPKGEESRSFAEFTLSLSNVLRMTTEGFRMTVIKAGIVLSAFLPLVVWYPSLQRNWHAVTSDYAYNLYQPLKKNAMLLGIGDLFGSMSYYMRTVDPLRQDVIPVIANHLYFNDWTRENFRNTTDIVISDTFEDLIRDQDPSKYNAAMNQFFADNIDKRSIYVLPFLITSSLFPGNPQGRLALDERFAFVPHGLTLQVVRSEKKPFIVFDSMNFVFRTPNFPEKKPFFFEKSYNRIYSDVLYQYGYALQGAGDYWMFEKENAFNGFYWYKKAQPFQPINAELFLRFGYYYAMQSQFDPARQYFEKAVSLGQGNPTYHYYLANAYLNLGRFEDAKREADAVGQLAPGSDVAKSIQEALGNIKNEK